jgi:hypothetical protein
MFARFKRFALVVLIPAVVGLGVWAQWTTLSDKFAMLGTSSAESMPAEITTDATDGVRLDARAIVPEIKPAPAPNPRPANGAPEPVQAEAVKASAEPAPVNPAAQVAPAPAGPKVKRLPFTVERRSENGVPPRAQAPAPVASFDFQSAQAVPAPTPPQAKFDAKPEAKPAPKAEAKPEAKPEPKPESKSVVAVEPPSAAKISSDTTATEAAKPQAQKKQATKSDDRQSEDDAPARKTMASKREKAEPATTQSRNGRSAQRERSFDPDDFSPRNARAAFTELRKSRSMADFYDRLEALGWGAR